MAEGLETRAQASGDLEMGLPRVCTVRQWSEAFGVSPHTVYRMAAAGGLCTVKVRGALRICRDKSLRLMGVEL